ncbi:hypothetical protein [Corynebacterium freiburgense]|nr:hypothetical protein [Corynebacterium freiburgense]WJZ03702.1 hypothetical protein CFREI_12225 [Corynebacterium freiburgense]
MFSDYIVLSLDDSLIKHFFASIEHIGKLAGNVSKILGLIK